MRLETISQGRVQAKGTAYAKTLRLPGLPLGIEGENAETREEVSTGRSGE